MKRIYLVCGLTLASLLNTNGVPYAYGGTEDFFGGQFYFVELPVRMDDFGVVSRGPRSHGYFYTTMYRYFRNFPVVFHSSLSFTWENGQRGEGTPPTINTAQTSSTTRRAVREAILPPP